MVATPINLVIGSAFRNAPQAQIVRWFSQIENLRAYIGDLYSFDVRAIAAEGDSADNTRQRIAEQATAFGIELSFTNCSHGMECYGSVEDTNRMRALSVVGNSIFDAVRDTDDILLYVESDLTWRADTIHDLVRRIFQGYSVVAPMIFAGGLFYDVWAFRADGGDRFSPFSPYSRVLTAPNEHQLPVEIESAGSCLVMRSSVARHIRITDDNALVGWCAEAKRHGYTIWVDPNLRVEHPA